MENYLRFIGARASCALQTTAEWMREYVLSHSAYAHDSVVSELICYDLMEALSAISHGDLAVPNLLGTDFVSLEQLKVPTLHP